MIKYNYNERLIEKLNIIPFIEKYNFNNEKYNTAIFCALSSIYNHKANYDHIESKSILLGDYYSFEYYSILKDDLDKLSILTDTMKVGYFQLVTKRMSDTLVHDVLEDILDITKCDDDRLNEIIKRYFLNGGKRVRVLLLLMCAKLGNFELNRKDIIRMASIVEIIHTASLIHDDIIDNADTRRGSITMNKEYTDEFALYVGDYLFAIVLSILLDLIFYFL